MTQFALADNVKETTTTTGLGTVSLLGAFNASSKTFVNGVGSGKLTAYRVDDGAGNYANRFGVVASGTPDTITNAGFISSSTGSDVSFLAGTKTVTIVPLTELFLTAAISPVLVETDIASATTTDLGSIQTLRARITGTTTITGFGASPNTMRFVRFAGALSLTHDATSLILIGGVSRVTAAKDIGIYISDGSGNWREVSYFPASGAAVIPYGQNKLINGGIVLDQRNAGVSQTLTAAAAVAYTVDRFYASCTGANVTGQQTANISGSVYAYGYKITGAASVTGTLFGQRVESKNIAQKDVSNNVTFQVELANTLLTTATWTAYYANSADNFSAKTQITTGTFTVNGTPTIYQATFNIGANAKNGVAIEITYGAQISGYSWYSGFKLESGSVFTPYVEDDYAKLLANCQRYYNRWNAVAGGSDVTGLASGFAWATTHAQFAAITHPAQMRTAPTFSVSAAGDFSVAFSGGSAVALSAIGAANTDARGASLAAVTTASASLTLGTGVVLCQHGNSAWYSNDAEL